MGFLQFAAIFYFLWMTWASFSFFYNRFNVDDALQRLLVFAQMFCIGGMAVSVAGVFDGDHMVFISCLATARIIIASMYARAWHAGGAGADMAQLYSILSCISAALWAVSLTAPSPWTYLLWGLAALVDFYGPISRRVREMDSQHPTDGGHIVERFGLLTIIVLGEMFVKVLSKSRRLAPPPRCLSRPVWAWSLPAVCGGSTSTISPAVVLRINRGRTMCGSICTAR